MSILVWSMVGIALWHFAVFVPDKFTGGIIGAFLGALGGALLTGYLLPVPGIRANNPPGLVEGLWPVPGAVGALALLYLHGARREARERSAVPAAETRAVDETHTDAAAA